MESPRPRRRLKAKTAVAAMPQATVVGRPLSPEPEAPQARQALGAREVFLVTFPHPKKERSEDGYPLTAPGSLSKADVLDRLLNACQSPVYLDAKNILACPPVPLLKTGIFRELHKETESSPAHPHDHAPLLAARAFRPWAVKRALLRKFGLATHWSFSHDGYWSCLRYVVRGSPGKPSASLDAAPVLWSAEGEHPPPNMLCNEPLTAAAVAARRQRADDKAAEEGAKATRITEIDVWPLVVANNFRNTEDDMNADKELMAHAKKHCTTAMQNFLFKHRSRLSGLIDDIWKWECVETDLAFAKMTRVESMQSAVKEPCQCHGQWRYHVLRSLDLNNIDKAALFSDIMQALTTGRSETTPVIVLAGDRGGEGKSMFLKGLLPVFGDRHVFKGPVPGNFPLVDLPGKKVVFLDEWRFDESILPFATQCLWYDGSSVPVARPQNDAGGPGHKDYKGTAPIFVTTKRADLLQLEAWALDRPDSGTPWDANASMLSRRLKVYHFQKRVPKPPRNLKTCARCFAELLLPSSTATSSSAAASRGVGTGTIFV